MIEINLLPEQTILSLKEKRLVSLLAIWSVVVGSIVAALFGGVFLVDRLVTARHVSMEQQYQELSNQFEGNLPRLVLLVGLKDKITGIKKVLAVRPDLPEAIEELKTFFVDGVEMTRVEMSAEGGLRFDVNARNGAVLNEFLDRVQSPMGKRFFKSLSVSGLTMNGDGGFSFSVGSSFNKDFSKESGT